jgi:predicted phosphodiesterase
VRVALLSDVHGNLLALEAVIDDLRRQSPDLVVHAGDLALSGPRPAEVVDRIRELGWPGVLGNADEVLVAGADRAPAADRAEVEVLRRATAELLGAERIAWLGRLPRRWRRGRLAVLHASPGDLWWAPPVEAPDHELADTYSPLGAEVVVYAHLHRPFVRRVGSLTVANTGSVAGRPTATGGPPTSWWTATG